MRMIPVLLTVTLLPAAAAAQSVSRIGGSGGSPDVISSEQIRQTGLECQRPSKAAQVWPSKIAHLAEVTSL